MAIVIRLNPYQNHPMKHSVKAVALTGLAFAVFGFASHAEQNLSGKWKGEFDSQIGIQKYTFDFKVDGDKLTGKAIAEREMETNEVAIIEGKIGTNEVSFVEPLKFDDNEIRIEYTGKVSGDEIKFHRKVGDFAEEDFVAKRVKDAAPKPEVKPEAKPQAAASTNSAPAKK
jgi:hypothetical protein